MCCNINLKTAIVTNLTLERLLSIMKMGEKILTKHITEIHEGKQFLNAHVALVHEGKKPFKCEICDDVFGWKGHMNRHIALHMKERSHSNVSFVTSAILKRET